MEGLQIPLAFAVPATTWQLPKMHELPAWKDARRICVDVETCDPTLRRKRGGGIGVRRGGYVCGIGFAIEDGPSFYLPIRHQGGDNLDEAQVWRYLRDQAKDFRGTIAGAKLSYDLDYLAHNGVEYKGAAWFRDVQVAEPLIYNLYMSYALDSIAERWGLEGKDETILRKAADAYGVDPKGGLWRLPGRFVGGYASRDVTLPLEILRRQEREIEKQDLQRVWDLESKLLPILVRQRRRGVAVDLPKVRRIEQMTLKVEQECSDIIKHAVGYSVGVGNFMNAQILEEPLRRAGIHLPRTPTGKPSITKDTALAGDHPVTKAIRRAREVAKLRGTYCQQIWDHQVNGRIHTTVNQTRVQKDDDKSGRQTDMEGAGPGRTSCVHPSVQNQPTRSNQVVEWEHPDPDGHVWSVEVRQPDGSMATLMGKAPLGLLWRSVYIPNEGGVWCCNDFSQQEPRFFVHYAEKLGFRGAREAGDRYRSDPFADSYDILVAIIKTLPRDIVKQIFLGRSYGMGGAKYCHQTGRPTELKMIRGEMREVAGEQGQRELDTFDAAVPYVQQLARYCERVARDRGWIKTYGGRHCHFEKDGEGNFKDTYKAGNVLAQGSGADQTKQAMVDADAAGFDVDLTVHDELDLTVYSVKQAFELREVMVNAVKITVPARVDVEIGPNWGRLKKIKALPAEA